MSNDRYENMDIPDQLQEMFHALGEQMGMTHLQLDREGLLSLEVDRRLRLNFQYRELGNEVWMYADLGRVNASDGGIYERLLKANLFWTRTAGATFSLSEDQPPHVILARSLVYSEMDFSGFEAAVELFMNTMEYWWNEVGASGELTGSIDEPREKVAEDTDPRHISNYLGVRA